MDDWQQVMNDADALAGGFRLEFHELRNAWGDLEVERDAEFYAGHGVTSSDKNHMLYGAMKSEPEAVEALARKLGKEKADRERIVNSIAETSGQHPTLVLQQLREFFAPI